VTVGAALFREAVDFLRSQNTSEKYLEPREESLKRFAPAAASPSRD